MLQFYSVKRQCYSLIGFLCFCFFGKIVIAKSLFCFILKVPQYPLFIIFPLSICSPKYLFPFCFLMVMLFKDCLKFTSFKTLSPIIFVLIYQTSLLYFSQISIVINWYFRSANIFSCFTFFPHMFYLVFMFWEILSLSLMFILDLIFYIGYSV